MMNNHYITFVDIQAEKSEVKLFIDGDAITIGLTDFEENNIPRSGSIDDLTFDLIKRFELKLHCMKKAVKALSYSALNSFKLKQKLSKDFPSEIIDEIVLTLSSKKYIDDEYLASRAAESYCYGKLYGPKKIRLQLYAKGFKQFEIDDALAIIPEDDYFNNMEKLKNKKSKSFDEEVEIDALKDLFFKYGYTDRQIYEYIQNL